MGAAAGVGVGPEHSREVFLGPSWLAVLVPRVQVREGVWVSRSHTQSRSAKVPLCLR